MNLTRFALSSIVIGSVGVLSVSCAGVGAGKNSTMKSQGVTVMPNEAARRVDVLVDGQPFTSYIWPDTLKKPVLFPLRAASGTVVTRGFPLEPRAGERTDHHTTSGFG